MIRALVFDFNGVLIDDEHVHFELFQEVLAEEGAFITERDYHERYLGFDDRRCLETALRDHGRPSGSELVEELIARKGARYLKRAEAGFRYFPHAREALHGLGARWPLAICSGALRPEIELALRQLGATELVRAIVPAEETPRCKPDPDGYVIAWERLRDGVAGLGDLRAEECLVLEDSTAGIQAAKGAGMKAVGVTNTYGGAELLASGADAVIGGLGELTAEWIEGRFGG